MIKTKREIKDIWKTNPFAVAWRKKFEIKCETCGVGLGRTKRYGRNLCNECEEKLYA